MQPSPAMPLARARSRCWLPPQPCTNRTPGTRVRGVRNVPSMNSCSTWIWIVSLRAVIGFHHGVLEQKTHFSVLATEDHRGVGGQRFILETLERRGAHCTQ